MPIVAVMKREFVDKRGWLDEREMLDYTAISQSTIGPTAVNASLLAGRKIAGRLERRLPCSVRCSPANRDDVYGLFLCTYGGQQPRPLGAGWHAGSHRRGDSRRRNLAWHVGLAHGQSIRRRRRRRNICARNIYANKHIYINTRRRSGGHNTRRGKGWSRAMTLIQLFFSFLYVGLFAIGGGYAIIPLIEQQVVQQHGWLTGVEFADIPTISQLTPGPIALNCASFGAPGWAG